MNKYLLTAEEHQLNLNISKDVIFCLFVCFNFVVLELEAKVKAITQASEGLKGIAAGTFCV